MWRVTSKAIIEALNVFFFVFHYLSFSYVPGKAMIEALMPARPLCFFFFLICFRQGNDRGSDACSPSPGGRACGESRVTALGAFEWLAGTECVLL